jgi:hypothetical protein
MMGIRRYGLLTPCVTSGRVYVELCPRLWQVRHRSAWVDGILEFILTASV